MPNSDYGIPTDVLEAAHERAEMALRYPEGFSRRQADRTTTSEKAQDTE